MDEEFIESQLRAGIKKMMARDLDGLADVNDRIREELSTVDGDEYSLLLDVMGNSTAENLGLRQPVKEFEIILTRIDESDLGVNTDFAEERLEELRPMLG